MNCRGFKADYTLTEMWQMELYDDWSTIAGEGRDMYRQKTKARGNKRIKTQVLDLGIETDSFKIFFSMVKEDEDEQTKMFQVSNTTQLKKLVDLDNGQLLPGFES